MRTAELIIAALIGCGLVSLAIGSRFVRKLKSPPQPVLDPYLNRNSGEAPASNRAPIASLACKPLESEPLPRSVVAAGSITPGEATSALAQLAESTASGGVGPTAICIPGNTAGAELQRAPRVGSESGAASVAFLTVKDSLGISEFADEPGITLRDVAEQVSLGADGQSMWKVKLTGSGATAFPIVAPSADEVDSESKKTGAAEDDSSLADAAAGANPTAVAEENILTDLGAAQGVGVPPAHLRPRLPSENGLQESATAPAVAIESQVIPTAPVAAAHSEESTPTIAVYRAPVLTPRPIPRSRSTRITPTARVSQTSLEVRLQLMISRSGDVHTAFLFKRPDGFPVSLTIKVRSKELPLSAYGDEWYAAEVADPTFLPDALRQGFIASERVTGNSRTSWMLSAGREIYVAAPQPGLGGFYAAPRLALGCTQIVLVREHLQAQALELLEETCGKPVPHFAQDRAHLSGWVVFGPVLPLKPLAQVPGEEAMNLLRPLPDISILLEGGLCLRDTEWLEGFPPQITVAGSVPQGERVLIDAIAASADFTGAYKTPGCYSAADHTIWCAGISRSYSISPPPQSWQSWQAHAQRRGSVCGALSNYQEVNPRAQLVTILSSNTVLIGAEPGEMHVGAGQGGEWMGIVPFAPVWALPANPFQCRKNTARIVLRASISVTRGGASRYKARAVKAWCRAILDCQRKGLTLESPSAAALWDGYVRAARAFWRNVR